MFIIEKPYASEFLVDTIIQNDLYVLDNKAVRESDIEEGAFRLCETIRKVTIGKNVTKIEYQAFFDCERLRQVVFESPYNIKEIGDYAFDETPWLLSKFDESSVVKIGNNTIEQEAFPEE